MKGLRDSAVRVQAVLEANSTGSSASSMTW
jgi:hypothetical protein